MTLIIFYLFLIFNLFSKLLLTDICLPFTFYFTIFPLLLYAFYLCPIPCVHSNQQSTAFATIVSEALFCLCRGPNIITLLGCDRISGHVPRLFISFFSFFVDSYFAGARETQEDTL